MNTKLMSSLVRSNCICLLTDLNPLWAHRRTIAVVQWPKVCVAAFTFISAATYLFIFTTAASWLPRYSAKLAFENTWGKACRVRSVADALLARHGAQWARVSMAAGECQRQERAMLQTRAGEPKEVTARPGGGIGHSLLLWFMNPSSHHPAIDLSCRPPAH
jgi:hypothetical protein